MTKEERIIRFMVEKYSRLGSVTRFSTIPNMCGESVAQHTANVAALTMLISDYLTEYDVEIDSLKAIKMSLWHDIEEIVSGDILGPLKQGKLGDELAEMNVKNVSYLFDSIGAPYNLDIWREYVEGKTLEARVVKLADFISLIIHAIKESQCGNKYFRVVIVEVGADLASYLEKAELNDPLIPLMSGFYSYILKYLEGSEDVMHPLEACFHLEVRK